MMLQLRPFLVVFLISGTAMMTGFIFIVFPLLKNQLLCYFKTTTKEKTQALYYSPPL